MDFAHLHALEVRLSHERVRLAASRTANERALRTVWVAQIEREIADIVRSADDDAASMTDDEILAALQA